MPPKQPSKEPTTWPKTDVTFDAAAIARAYAAARPALAKDPLFVKDAADYGVSLDTLDARMKAPPKRPDGDKLYVWLDGADQYRYAGLLVLLRALGGAKPIAIKGRTRIPEAATRVVCGDVALDGDLILDAQAMLIVLGKLAVSGVIVGESFDYTMIAAREITCAGGVTSGELIAAERIVATGPFYFAGNDYSARSPLFQGGLLVDFERGNAFTKVKVKQRLKEWNFDKAAKALGVPGEGDLATEFRDKLLG